jgi:hypothetical protein
MQLANNLISFTEQGSPAKEERDGKDKFHFVVTHRYYKAILNILH